MLVLVQCRFITDSGHTEIVTATFSRSNTFPFFECKHLFKERFKFQEYTGAAPSIIPFLIFQEVFLYAFKFRMDSFWSPFAVKFIGGNRSEEKEENKLRHN